MHVDRLLMLPRILQMPVFFMIQIFRAGSQPEWHPGNVVYACKDFVQIAFIKGALIPAHPVAHKGRPVRAAAHTSDRIVIYFLRYPLGEMTQILHGLIRIPAVFHHIPKPVVPGQIVIKTLMAGHPDPRLLTGASPMTYIMSGTDPPQRPEVIHIHLGAMACHSLREDKSLFISRPDKK